MFPILFLLSFFPPFLLYLLSRTSENGRLAGSAAHPYNILGFFLVVINLNFFWANIRVEDSHQIYFARYSLGGTENILQGMIYFTICSFIVTISILSATLFRLDLAPRNPLLDSFYGRSSKRVFLVAIALASFASASFVESALARGGLFSIAMMRQTFLSQNTYLVPMYSLLLPAFVFWSSYSDATWRVKILAALAALVILLPIGSRSALLYIALSLFIVFNIKIAKLPALSLYVLSPLLVLFLIVLRYFRAYSETGSFSEFLQVYEGRLLFGGADFQFAEPIIFLLNDDLLPRYPFESWFAALLAYVPRSLVPIKPEGPSAVFSMLADPERWQLVQSEWIIGGLANLYVENGPIFGPLILSILAFIWARVFRGAALSGSDKALACTAAYCTIIGFLFIRTDVYNLSFFLWPLLIIKILHWVVGGSYAAFRRSN